MLKKITLIMLVLSASLFVNAADYVEGKHYQVLPEPVLTRDKTKVEVVELFWYGCSHCFRFEPTVQAWKKKLPADVDFVQMPAMWNKTMEIHAAVFYTAQALGVLDKVHQPFFNALNVDKRPMTDIDDIAAFFKRFGIEPDLFKKTMSSFGVQSQVTLAKSRGRSYRLQGTPEIVVNGKYRISAGMVGGQPQMLQVAEFLIEKERALLPAPAAQ